MKHFWEEESHFINELGIKWWLDEQTTKYATRPDSNGISLNLTVWVTEKPDEVKQYVIVNDAQHEVIFSHTVLENIACHIDILKCEEKFRHEKQR